jgi:cytochrome c oxidase subunit II
MTISTSQAFFQDPVTPIAEGIFNLHNDIMFFIMFILGFVFVFLYVAVDFHRTTETTMPSANAHGTLIEVIWTIVPTLILVVIAFPTFALIYSLDEGIDPDLTVKVIGNQWFWHYEYSDMEDKPVSFDSYPLDMSDAQFNDYSQFRLLSTDNPVVLPIDKHIRVAITATDVLHCWAVPSMGIKMDAVPGRLNQAFLYINNVGRYFGQCSEICGANHGFMPIDIKATNVSSFIKWLVKMSESQ